MTADTPTGPLGPLLKAGDFLCAVIEHCDVTDGVCCCGDDMARHSAPMACGHAPTDNGAYQASRAVDSWKAARAACESPSGSNAASAEAIRKEVAEVLGCFEAAEAEGLQERLAEADDFEPGSLAGLVRRRLLPAHDAAARLAALLPPAQEERADG